MIDTAMLEAWLKKRKKRSKEEAAKKPAIGLPNGLTIHINVNSGDKPQKLPLTDDGKYLATRDSVAKYPS